MFVNSIHFCVKKKNKKKNSLALCVQQTSLQITLTSGVNTGVTGCSCSLVLLLVTSPPSAAVQPASLTGWIYSNHGDQKTNCSGSARLDCPNFRTATCCIIATLQRNFNTDKSHPIWSLWSPSRGPSKKDPITVLIVACALVEPGQLAPKTIKAAFPSHCWWNKGPLINEPLNDQIFDFFCLTETNDFTQLNQTAHPDGLAEEVVSRSYTGRCVKCLRLLCLSRFQSTVLQISGPVPTMLANIYPFWS